MTADMMLRWEQALRPWHSAATGELITLGRLQVSSVFDCANVKRASVGKKKDHVCYVKMDKRLKKYFDTWKKKKEEWKNEYKLVSNLHTAAMPAKKLCTDTTRRTAKMK